LGGRSRGLQFEVNSGKKFMSPHLTRLGVVGCACHLSYRGKINRRSCFSIKQEPISKKSKKNKGERG
jgi:hypothetical protein